jgi:hypothetical protein
VASGGDIPPFELFVSSLLDGITGFLAAQASRQTIRRLGPAAEVSPHGLGLL